MKLCNILAALAALAAAARAGATGTAPHDAGDAEDTVVQGHDTTSFRGTASHPEPSADRLGLAALVEGITDAWAAGGAGVSAGPGNADFPAVSLRAALVDLDQHTSKGRDELLAFISSSPAHRLMPGFVPLSPALHHGLHHSIAAAYEAAGSAASHRLPIYHVLHAHHSGQTPEGGVAAVHGYFAFHPEAWWLSDALSLMDATAVTCRVDGVSAGASGVGEEALVLILHGQAGAGDVLRQLKADRAAVYAHHHAGLARVHSQMAVGADAARAAAGVDAVSRAMTARGAASKPLAVGTLLGIDADAMPVITGASKACAHALAPQSAGGPFATMHFHVTDLAAGEGGDVAVTLAPVTSAGHAVLSMDLRYVADPAPNANVGGPAWWQPHVHLDAAAVRAAACDDGACINSGELGSEGSGTHPAFNFPTGLSFAEGLNYNPSTKFAAQSLPLLTGISCSDCWASLTAGLSGSLAFCAYPIDGFIWDHAGGLCKTSDIAFYINVTTVLSGDLEVNFQLLAGDLPESTEAVNFYPWTTFIGAPIPLGPLAALDVTLTPGFALGSDVSTSPSLYGLNGTVALGAHAGSNDFVVGITIGGQTAHLEYGDPVYSYQTIQSFQPVLTTQTPTYSGLPADEQTAGISLVPRVQFNVSMLGLVLPIDLLPHAYLELEIGAPDTENPAPGSPICNATGNDSYYQVAYGATLNATVEPLIWSLVIPSPIYYAWNITLLDGYDVGGISIFGPDPVTGDEFSGCVSSTWDAPTPTPHPRPPSGSGAGGSEVHPAAIAGGVVGAVLVVSALAAVVVVYRRRGGLSRPSEPAVVFEWPVAADAVLRGATTPTPQAALPSPAVSQTQRLAH